MGFANLMMLPLRVEYLANERYGLALSTSTIALLTGVIPNLARLVVSPLWGRLFDQINFFLLRIILNLGFALGILTFFTGKPPAAILTTLLLLTSAVTVLAPTLPTSCLPFCFSFAPSNACAS